MSVQEQAIRAKERRKFPRIRTLKAARIQLNDRLSALDCVVRDLSVGGACIQVASPSRLPDLFSLSIPIDGLQRMCRVAWRSEDRLGVAFCS